MYTVAGVTAKFAGRLKRKLRLILTDLSWNCPASWAQLLLQRRHSKRATCDSAERWCTC